MMVGALATPKYLDYKAYNGARIFADTNRDGETSRKEWERFYQIAGIPMDSRNFNPKEEIKFFDVRRYKKHEENRRKVLEAYEKALERTKSKRE